MVYSHFYCGEINLPPTSGPYPEDSDGIYHYQGCCHKYDMLLKENKKNAIMCNLYEFKINGWECLHDAEYYDLLKINMSKKYEETYKDVPNDQRPPPYLIFKFNFPDCCKSHTNPRFMNYINKINYKLSDALNDPETIEKFNSLYPDF